MKNKTLLLTIITLGILSNCGLYKYTPDDVESTKNNTQSIENNNIKNPQTSTDNQSANTGNSNINNTNSEPAVKIGKSIAEKLEKIPENAEFFSNNNSFSITKDETGKWKYNFHYSNSNPVYYNPYGAVSHFPIDISANFTKDDFKQEGDFDVIENGTEINVHDYDKFSHNDYKLYLARNNVKTKLKIARTDLTYAHYGFFDLEYDICLRSPINTVECFFKTSDSISHKPFFMGRQDKIKFEPPQKDIKFSGVTHAVLNRESGKEIKDLKGRADMTINADSSKGDITFKYDNWDKTVKATGYDFVHRKNPVKLEVSGLEVDKENSYLKSYIFDNKEAIGTYELKMTDGVNNFTLDGGFGMKKE